MLSDTAEDAVKALFTAVLMHLVVLGAFGPVPCVAMPERRASLNAPCGAGCFRTKGERKQKRSVKVLMHLVVLGAFGHRKHGVAWGTIPSLNAPCGAGCFRTVAEEFGTEVEKIGLNAPCGAGCFRTGNC